jgi:hypothetical protein
VSGRLDLLLAIWLLFALAVFGAVVVENRPGAS